MSADSYYVVTVNENNSIEFHVDFGDSTKTFKVDLKNYNKQELRLELTKALNIILSSEDYVVSSLCSSYCSLSCFLFLSLLD